MLRILSGSYKGCSLLGVSGLRTRPSSQRVRTQVFDVLCGGRITTPPDWSQTSVLDGFCGFGTLGLEALSRGARMVFFLEKSFPCVQITRRNLARLGAATRGKVIRCDVLRPPRAQEGVSLVFLDPPYGSGLACEALISLRRCDWLREEALIAVESSRKEEIVPSGDEFSVLGERFCGSSRWTFLRFSSACKNVPQARKAGVRNDLPSIQNCTDVPARRD